MKEFSIVVDELDEGKIAQQARDLLAQTVLAVRETGRKGSLTLTIQIERQREDGLVAVAGEIKAKIPQPKVEKSLFFTDKSGELHRDDPRQKKLPFKSVPTIAKDATKGEG